MSAPMLPPMSPAQAAQAAGTSRWSVMRAIKAGVLRATRDNHNNWQIAPDDLALWRDAHRAHGAHHERTPDTALPDTHSPAQPALPDAALREEVQGLRIGLAVATTRVEAAEARALAAEADRDAWRAQAERLAARPAEPARRGWWPWARP